jgi:ribosome recycling factor
MTISEFKQKASKSVEHFEDTLKAIRTGRANPGLVEDLQVDAYGGKMPLMQLGSISAPEPRLLTIALWDKSVVDAVVNAIKNSDLGVQPNVDGTLIRINLPMMTEERRKDLVKVVGKHEEETKVAVRNLRREFLDALKKREKDEKLPEDMVKTEEANIEVEVKKVVTQIEEVAKAKEKDLMEI